MTAINPNFGLTHFYCHPKKRIKWEDVVHMEGDRNYTLFVFRNGQQYLASRSMCTFEPRLPAGFVRIHKSSIVQLAFVKTIDRYEKTLCLTDGTILQVARRRWKEVVRQVIALRL
ncbi:MAG: LytTR family transcriptional regulator [Spirosomaceae bacterium]|jgi:two-component system LytT family response regulator|nr:LytTR family transcriptional regulator [Spirosomataceae bacterium]